MASNVAYELEGRVKLDASQADKELDRATNSAKSKANGWTGLFSKAGQGIAKAFSIQPDGKLSNWIGQVGNKFSALRNTADRATSNGFGMGAAMGVGMAAFNTLSGGFGSLISDTVDASDSMQKFKSTMKFAGIDDGAINKAGKSAKKYADDTVYDLQTITSTTAQLAANGIKNYTELTEAAGNVNAVAGGNADTFKSVAMVMTQTAGAGKLTTENWNQLADAIPGASGKLQDAMLKNGAYTGNFRDAMANGEITADEFNKAISDLGMTDAAKNAAASTATFEGAIGNLQAGIVTQMNGFIDQVGKKNITDLISMASGGIGTVMGLVGNVITFLLDNKATITSIIDTVVGVIKGIISAIQDVVSFVMEHQAIFQPIAIAVGILAGAILAVVAAISAFNIVMGIASVLFSPVTLVIMGIVAVIALIVAAIQNWGTIVEWLSTIWSTIKVNIQYAIYQIQTTLTTVWNAIKTTITNVMNSIMQTITNVWNSILQFFQPFFAVLQNIFVVALTILAVTVGTLFNIIKAAITFVWDAVTAYFNAVFTFWSTIFTTAFNFIFGIVSTAFNAIRSVIMTVWNAISPFVTNAVNGIRNVITNVFTSVSNFVSNVWNGIKNVISSVVSAVSGTVSNVFNGVRNNVSSIFSALSNVVSSIWNSIKNAISNVVDGIRGTVSNVFNSIAGIASGAFNAVKNAIMGPINSARDIVRSAIDQIKSFFNFSISFPHVPLPHFSIKPKGWAVGDLLKGKIPSLGVDFYAKGGIMTSPTIFGMNGGNAMVGGEAGREAVLPLNRDTLGMIGDGIVAATNSGVDQKEPIEFTVVQHIHSNDSMTPRELQRQSRTQFEKAARDLL